MTPILYIGNKNYSSWSLRPYLCLRWARIPFTERLIRLDQPGYGRAAIAEVRAISPTGQVPLLALAEGPLWDSLAIAEWAAEETRGPALWPADRRVRALCRSVACEVHTGFVAVRRDLPMNLKRRCPEQSWPEDTRAGLQRISQLITELRGRFSGDGPFLFGARSIADAFLTPTVSRLRTYSVPLSPVVAAYRDALLSDPDFRAWEEEALPDSWDASGYSVIDGLYRGGPTEEGARS